MKKVFEQTNGLKLNIVSKTVVQQQQMVYYRRDPGEGNTNCKETQGRGFIISRYRQSSFES